MGDRYTRAEAEEILRRALQDEATGGGDCGETQFYPRGVCSHCLSSNLDWIEASGEATVYSCSVNYRAGHPGFAEKTPFVLAIVELAEGPRMMTNIVNCDPETVKIGMAVKVCFDDVTDDVTLPMFEPA